MRILRFICWVRGFHAGYFTASSLTIRDDNGGQDWWGNVSDCLICGQPSPRPSFTASAILAKWKLK